MCPSEEDRVAFKRSVNELQAEVAARKGVDPANNSYFLWYVNNDGEANFNDFAPFGIFTSENVLIKGFGLSDNVCNIPAALDWWPGGF